MTQPTQAFFDDAADHDVGHNGLSIPVRNRKGVRSLVSFTSNHSKDDWAKYKSRNMVKLQPMAVLINSAARINFKLTPDPVELSKREEECLIWAARGKTYHDIAGLLNLSFASVKTYLDTARHKLSCIQLDARGRRRHRNWSHTGESAEMAVLTCAHRRPHFESSFTIVDVAGDDGFGDRVEAASAGCDEPYKLDRGRDWRSDASSLLAALMCVFVAEKLPASAESNSVGTLLPGRMRSR